MCTLFIIILINFKFKYIDKRFRKYLNNIIIYNISKELRRMKDIIFDSFQNDVSESLLRHKSILDILTKYTESSSRVNRAVAKAVTNCGCINIKANKQCLPEEDSSIDELYKCLDTHVYGNICENCREIIEREIGNNLFYLTSLCNTLDISLYDALIKENDKINTLGKFTFR